MPHVDYSIDEGSGTETFINMDANQRFSKYFSGMSMLSERGFILDKKEENLCLLGDIVVKEFYANLVDTDNKRAEVVVQEVKVSYSTRTINMIFNMGNTEDMYQEILVALDDDYY
ncbi:hypothetical protein RYX36_013401 [Vicia faba]